MVGDQSLSRIHADRKDRVHMNDIAEISNKYSFSEDLQR